MMDEMRDINAAIEAGRLLAGAQHADDGSPFVVVPEGYSVESLERLLPAPARKTGRLVLAHEKSFCTYVNDHKDDDSIVVADAARHRLTAILDHHRKTPSGAARWGGHIAQLDLPMEDDWKTIKAHNDKLKEQVEFAQLVEDLLPRITKPDGADLLELAQRLEATNKLTFKSAERLSDGSRELHFAQEVQGKVGNSKVEVPEEFVFLCPVYWRGDPVEVTAKMRYRIKEGVLLFWYHLHRWQDAEDEAFKRVCDAIKVETDIDPLLGPIG